MHSPVPSALLYVGLLVAVAGVLNAVVRVLLCAIAIRAACKALADVGSVQQASAIRSHRLAVLQVILGGLGAKH
jgi:uncharacterized membrane protein